MISKGFGIRKSGFGEIGFGEITILCKHKIGGTMVYETTVKVSFV
jgi:hypothetical protein